MIDLNYPIDGLVKAEYNPRVITPESEDALMTSIQSIGMAKPVIVRGKTIVAGHQRVAALRKLGAKNVPVFLLPEGTTTYDEVSFNQLHNGTDLDLGVENARVTCDIKGKRGFINVPSEHLTASLKCEGAVIRIEINRLVGLYGNWGSVVATDDGEIIHCAQYAISIINLGKPLLVFVIDSKNKDQFRKLLGDKYGKFSYDHIERFHYMQSFVQPYRHKANSVFDLEGSGEGTLYTKLLHPILKKNRNLRVLDFGSGRGENALDFRKKGFNICNVEFFFRDADGHIDQFATNAMINRVIWEIKNNGRFDVVVCDYVLNSINSMQAEDDVLRCLQYFAKPKGIICFSGRNDTKELEKITSLRGKSSLFRRLNFADDNGLTANYRKGSWVFQKFHSKEQRQEILTRMGWEQTRSLNHGSYGWAMQVVNSTTIDREKTIASLGREFDMILNIKKVTQGRSLGIIEAFEFEQEKNKAVE